MHKIFFNLIEWIGFFICLLSIYINGHYPKNYPTISAIFIFVGGVITLTFFLIRRILDKKGYFK